MTFLTSLTTFASEAAIPLTPSVLAGIGTAMAAGITAAWAWFRSELNECKRDRNKLFARVEELHEEITALSIRVGQVECRRETP